MAPDQGYPISPNDVPKGFVNPCQAMIFTLKGEVGLAKLLCQRRSNVHCQGFVPTDRKIKIGIFPRGPEGASLIFSGSRSNDPAAKSIRSTESFMSGGQATRPSGCTSEWNGGIKIK